MTQLNVIHRAFGVSRDSMANSVVPSADETNTIQMRPADSTIISDSHAVAYNLVTAQ